MSNKSKIFQHALDASRIQHNKTYNDIIPSIFVTETFGSQKTDVDTTNLWQGLWAQGEMACLFGTPCVGKSILAMQIAKELHERKLTVTYFDLENNVYPLTPLFETTSPSEDDELTPDEKINFIAETIALHNTQAAIIDNISLLVDTKKPNGMQQALNRLRVICQHNGTAMLLLAHSRKRKNKDLTTTDELQNAFEIMHSCDSVFSLSETSRKNSTTYRKSHYIKQHKNRMAPVILSDDAVMAMQLTTTNEEHLVFSNFQRHSNERQLVRDNGFSNHDYRNKAIAHFRSLNYSTREIATLVGLSQAQVSRIAKKLQQPLDIYNREEDLEDVKREQKYRDFIINPRATQQIAPQAHLHSKHDSCDSRNASNLYNKSNDEDAPDFSAKHHTNFNPQHSNSLSDRSGKQSEACDAYDSCNQNVNKLGEKKSAPRYNTNSSLKKLIKKSHNTNSK